MKLFYAIVLVLMVLVSACTQQPGEQPPVVSPKTEPTAEPGAEVEEPEVVEAPEEVGEEVAEATSNEVRILGKGGFDPMELTISAGSAVTWVNNDKKELTLAIFKDGKFYMNSPKIKTGEGFENEFTEAGEYEYWAVAYGVKAKITVE